MSKLKNDDDVFILNLSDGTKLLVSVDHDGGQLDVEAVVNETYKPEKVDIGQPRVKIVHLGTIDFHNQQH